MRIGVCGIGYQCAEHLADVLKPWLALKESGPHQVFISVAHGVFPEVEVVLREFPEVPDNSVFLLREHLTNRQIDALHVSLHPQYEWDLRTCTLPFLIRREIDLLWLLDLQDEIYSVEEITRTVDFVSQHPEIAWFKINFKNYAFAPDCYVDDFVVPRIWRAEAPAMIRSFHYDNSITYENGVRQEALPFLTVPRSCAFPRHLSWVGSPGYLKRKIRYQNLHFKGMCSYRWDEDENCLKFNEDYYRRLKKPIPRVYRDSDGYLGEQCERPLATSRSLEQFEEKSQNQVRRRRMQIANTTQVIRGSDGQQLLEVDGRPLFQLNLIAATIWTKVAQGFSVEEIISQIVLQYGAPENTAARDVHKFIDLLKHNFIVLEDDVASPEQLIDSHAALVWNRGIAAMCDWRIPNEFVGPHGFSNSPGPAHHERPPDLLDDLIVNPRLYEEIRDGDLVWVKFSWLKSFLKQVVPLVKASFVLVTGDSDVSVPSKAAAEIAEVVACPNILHWFTQNCDAVGFRDRVWPLPIGIDFHTLIERPAWGEETSSSKDQERLLYSIRQELPPIQERVREVYLDFAWQRPEYRPLERRAAVVEKLRGKPAVHCQERPVRRSQMWRRRGQYAFVVSPLGGGMDCHRTWEALALGHIVIVPASPLDSLYEGVPVISVKDWDDITPENLDRWLADCLGRELHYERLTSKYWVDKMRTLATESLATAARPQ